jgi:hypothetical protein
MSTAANRKAKAARVTADAGGREAAME